MQVRYIRGTKGSLILPESLEEIGDYAFYGCTFAYEDPDATGGAMINGGIDSVVIGGKVTRIGARAFAYMASLKAVILGSAVTEIGERAFYGCGALKKAELPQPNTGIKKLKLFYFTWYDVCLIVSREQRNKYVVNKKS